MSSSVWRRWGLLESHLGAQGSVALSSTAFLQGQTRMQRCILRILALSSEEGY